MGEERGEETDGGQGAVDGHSPLGAGGIWSVKKLLADETGTQAGLRAYNVEEARRLLRQSIVADTVFFKDPTGAIVMIGQKLVDHTEKVKKRLDGRGKFFPFIPIMIRFLEFLGSNFHDLEISLNLKILKIALLFLRFCSIEKYQSHANSSPKIPKT